MSSASLLPTLRTRGMSFRIALWIAKLGILSFISYKIFSKIPFGETLAHIQAIAPATVFFVLLLLMAHAVVSAERWHIVIKNLEGSAGWRPILKAVFAERLINQAVPSTIGGDAARVMMIAHANLPLPKAFLSVLFDRVLAIGGIILMVAIFYPLACRFFTNRFLLDLLGALIGISCAGILTLFLFPLALLNRMATKKWLAPAAKTIKAARIFFANPSVSLAGLGLSALTQLFLIVSFQLIVTGLGAKFSFIDALITVPAISLSGLIPLTLAGWGVREGAALIFLAQIGIPPEIALAASILYGILTLLAAAIGGIFWLMIAALHPAHLNQPIIPSAIHDR